MHCRIPSRNRDDNDNLIVDEVVNDMEDQKDDGMFIAINDKFKIRVAKN
jgi:hypothetical protein